MTFAGEKPPGIQHSLSTLRLRPKSHQTAIIFSHYRFGLGLMQSLQRLHILLQDFILLPDSEIPLTVPKESFSLGRVKENKNSEPSRNAWTISDF